MFIDKHKSIILVVTAAMLWGTFGSFVTAISACGMSGTATNFLRFLATSVPVCIYLFIKDRSQFRIRAKDLPLFLANGLISILFFTICYTACIRETKIATAAALLYTSPAMVMILSAFLFKEKLTVKKCLCVLLAVTGCAFVSGIGMGGSAGLTLRGLLLGLGSALGYSLYSIFSRLIQERGYSILTNIAYTFSIATAAYFFIVLFNGTLPQVWQLKTATALGLLSGLITGLLAYLFYTVGLSKMEPSRAAQLATVEPVFATVLGVVLFHQPLSLSELAGIIMVVAAVIIMNRNN